MTKTVSRLLPSDYQEVSNVFLLQEPVELNQLFFFNFTDIIRFLEVALNIYKASNRALLNTSLTY